MILKITLEQGEVKLEIKKEGKNFAQKQWQGELSLSEKLLSEIDNLLKENKISKDQIEKIETFHNDKSSVTSVRIIQTVADAWNF